MIEINRLLRKIKEAVGENVFVVNKSDLEAYECIKLLKEHGYEEEKNLFTIDRKDLNNWEMLDSEILAKLDEAFTIIDVDIKLPDGKLSNEYLTVKEYNALLENFGKEGMKQTASDPIFFSLTDYVNLYGVKMTGTAPKFGDNIEKTDESVIKQVSKIINAELEMKQKLLGIYINFGEDKLVEEAKKYQIEKNNIEKFIQSVDDYSKKIDEKQKERIIADLAESYKKDALINNSRIKELSEDEYKLSDLINILKKEFEYEITLPEGFDIKPSLKGCIQIKGSDIPFEINYRKDDERQKEICSLNINEKFDSEVLKTDAFINYSTSFLKNLEQFKKTFGIEDFDEDIIDFINIQSKKYINCEENIKNAIRDLVCKDEKFKDMRVCIR